jgi:uncharacterized protein (DUF1800 family)
MRFRNCVASISAAFLSAAVIAASAAPLDRSDATRLLEQSTFGPTDALVAHVQAVGVQGWLNEQFAAPPSRYPSFPYVPPNPVVYCAGSPNLFCVRDNYSLFLLQNAFFKNALSGPDQLRQRVAFALSQVLVTSGLVVRFPYGMGPYQQLFIDGAFGNFEDLLNKVTLSPVMGDYLDMVNNDKPTGGVEPNENYARELMQLFSIGVWELKADGTLLTDANGAPIPSYDQETIEGLAHIMTGWTYAPRAGGPARNHYPRNYAAPMVGISAEHDYSAKVLFEDIAVAPGKPMEADLAFAIHTVFSHPNVGPFIGRQLIQKLVTGDPTPQYVARVAAVFNNNGAGVRGDLKALVNAILTDPEARGNVKSAAGYGKLREPVLYVTATARALGTASDGVFLAQQSRALGQDLFNAPSVFNYYPPSYVVPGTTANGPEFALLNASTSINRYNFANALAFGTIGPILTLPGAIGTTPNWGALQAVAGNPAALLDKLDALLMHGTMGSDMRSAILSAVNAIPASNSLARAKTAYYLTITSPQYQVER